MAKIEEEIIKYTKDNNYSSLRLIGSALNLESFSLYNRLGFVPRNVYHTMLVNVTEGYHFPVTSSIRGGDIDDIDAIAKLEISVSGLSRKNDYKFGIEDSRKIFELNVHIDLNGQIDGYLLSSKHPASCLIGPGVAKTEEIMCSLIKGGLSRFKGGSVMILLPMQNHNLVKELYSLGARNVETHLYQVWGEFTEFKGIVLPSFFPESG